MTLPLTRPTQTWDIYSQDNAPAVGEMVSDAIHAFTHLWWDCATILPYEQTVHTRLEQIAAETEMNRFLHLAQPVLINPPHSETEQQGVRQRLLPAARQAAQTIFGLQTEHLDALGINDFAEIAIQFARQARQFDPSISFADIYQAARNVITTNMLQRLWGMPVALNQAIFAYSMLYPYTDNYLDDPALSNTQKHAFSQHFSLRLEGEAVQPANAHEARIFDLVGLIEAEYDRELYPQVFDCLLAIHRGQTRSLALLQPGAAPYTLDVLGISIEKGGTSTLADGYLIAGWLTPLQEQFAFGLGAFLQLGDDLEDVLEDRKVGIQTVFSQVAGHWPLDALTSRTMHFGLRVFDLLDELETPPALCEFVRQCTFQPFVTAIHRARKFYTRDYLHLVEKRSAFAYRHLDRQGRWLRHWQKQFGAVLEKVLQSEDSVLSRSG